MSSTDHICFISKSSRCRSFKYDIFLTTSDPIHPEIRAYFDRYLRDAGITTLIDDPMEEFSKHDIQSCEMVVVIFTPQFSESDVFLKRLVNIRRCQKLMNIKVLPVFCGVSEEQVRKQLEKLDFILNSRGAIAEAAMLLDSRRGIAEDISLYGFTLVSDFGNRINNRTAKLGLYMFCNDLFQDLPHHQVGFPLRARELLEILGWKYVLSRDTVIVRISGDEGVGKTAFARAFYDIIGGNFEHKSFFTHMESPICEIDGTQVPQQKQHKNVVSLQKQLLPDISENELAEINNVELIIHGQMEQIPRKRRVLVVFDNVFSAFHLMKLWDHVRWIGEGSLVFIITRTSTLTDSLDQSVSVEILYKMNGLHSNESLELFSLHAFNKLSPTNGFENLSWEIISFCQGLPLALEVIGSLLHNRTKPEWKDVLKKLKGFDPFSIEKVLKISFDFLSNAEKDLFFNIAIFNMGQSKHYVTQLLKGSRLHVEMGMPVLIKQNLVKVTNDDKIHVHDLLRKIASEVNPSKPKLKYIYDVFLSFRGEDVRKSFATHLCIALKQAGIQVYMDEERIERGENISSSLLQAIESSKISIIIFSKNYAGSSWCLQELEKIMECYKTTYQEVLPIFFDVRASEVRKQENAFGKSWKRLIRRTSGSKMKNLTINIKRSLKEVANLAGWDMYNFRTERELIDEVIETITIKLGDNNCLFVAHHPVGLKSRVQDIIQLLSSKSNEVIIAGIWGMGGIGKTTIAKAIYNKVGQSFEGKCFLANVREVWKQENGQVYLQEQLLSGILKTRRMIVANVEMGKTQLKNMLCKKRVLVVLDDVNSEDQLQALCGSRDWFGQGSKIIITTRDERLLKILRVIHVSNVKEMDDNESLELFSWHAFKQAMPEQDFDEFSRRVVSYSGGLPLALEILGSYLFDRDILTWKSVLEKLQLIPNDQINEKLKISYDGLSDHTEKDIFLDICCFLIGKDKSYATKILNGCGLHAEIGINRLIELSLVKVGNRNKLHMHDLLRDMGREIIREQFPEEPEKRTRLWFCDDVLDVLRNSTGTSVIKGLALNMSRNNSLSLNAKAFKKMKKLRLLQLDHIKLDGDYGYLANELRWLCWHGFPLQSMPMSLCLEKIVAIDLKWSNLTKVWEKSQLLEQLKILNLSHSHCLTETPNFSKLPYLEKLILKDCSHLSMIHPSIGKLRYIIFLNLKDCKSLKHLPKSLYKLKSLKTLNLSGCSKVEKLEEDIEQMDSLTTLVANQTAITQVPFSLVRLKSIKYVSLCGYEGLSREIFPSLVWSWISPTHHSKSLFRASQIIPSLIRGLSHPLFGRRYEISETRPSTSQSSCLKTPALEMELITWKAHQLHEQVDHMERSTTFLSSLSIHVGGLNKVIDMLLKSISQGWSTSGGLDFSLPKDNYPNWVVFENEGSLISFKVPQLIDDRYLKGMVLFIIYSSLQDSMTSICPTGFMITNFTKGTTEWYKQDATTSHTDKEWPKVKSDLEPGSEVEVEVKFAHKCTVKKVAVYLVYVEETNEIFG